MAKKKDMKAAKNAQEAQAAQEEKEARMPLSRRNYVLMLIGLGVVIAGFALMAGGGSDDPAVFSRKMFGWRRITLAPIVVIAGFAFEIFAIMWRPSAGKDGEKTGK